MADLLPTFPSSFPLSHWRNLLWLHNGSWTVKGPFLIIGWPPLSCSLIRVLPIAWVEIWHELGTDLFFSNPARTNICYTNLVCFVLPAAYMDRWPLTPMNWAAEERRTMFNQTSPTPPKISGVLFKEICVWGNHTVKDSLQIQAFVFLPPDGDSVL